jgi:hypothetical protein
MARSKRQITPDAIVDSHSIESLGYNLSAGAFKNLTVGPKLNPLNSNGSTYTTNATTANDLGQPGKQLAVYNNSNAVGSITTSPSAIASLAPGTTDVNGNVGVACPPNAWIYIAMGDDVFVIASAATLLVYEIEDDSYLLTPQPAVR